MSGFEIAFWIVTAFAVGMALIAGAAWTALDRIREELDGKQ